MSAMLSYNDVELKNVAGGDLGLETEEEKRAAEEAAKENESLLNAMQEALGEKVTKVAISTRLTDSPVCITASGPISLEMEKILASQPGDDGLRSERVLELNAEHPVFEVLKAAQDAGESDKVELYANILYSQALLVEGLPLEDPIAYAQQITKLMA